eukprot:m.27332 g.27332  ORF g.27332 m.27332 type:complete len:78 (+) comp29924_c0_seq1:393-626(+)
MHEYQNSNKTLTGTIKSSLSDVSTQVSSQASLIKSLQTNASTDVAQLADLQARLKDLESRVNEHAVVLIARATTSAC